MSRHCHVITIAAVLLSLAAAPPATSQPDQRQATIFARITAAPPSDRLRILDQELSNVRSYLDADKFGVAVNSAFNTLYERDLPDRDAAGRSEQHYVLAALESPDLLKTDTELWLLL